MKRQKVFVGLSGGVDSSVAALRLLRQGYEVVGVFIKVWQPDFLKCDWERERLDAMRVAAHLGIPFLTCDAEAEYKRHVGDHFVNEYLAGRTPNPDVLCNRFVKFGAFWKFARERGADFIATGHYARTLKTEDRLELRRGVDQAKDQSYFLWTLTEEDLRHVLFPVGDSPKAEIRREAEKAGLPTAVKKDSQGICFLGHIDIPEFIGHFTDLSPGQVFDVHGQVVGEHRGSLVYTLGQRHGFTIFGENAKQPYFVVSKDLASNTLIVDVKPPSVGTKSDIELTEVNWISGRPEGENFTAVFRYRGEAVPVTVATEGGKEKLSLGGQTDKPASGQSVVFYRDEVCLGGAVIR